MARAKKGKLYMIPVLEHPFAPTPIVRMAGDYSDNDIYIKRDDLLPFSFGGNKARKAQSFYQDIMKEQPDVLVTYGSNASNHCRIIANMAKSMGLACHIIANDHEIQGKDGRELFNRVLVEDFGASVETVPVEEVHETIEKCLAQYRAEGRKPYFIQGGGHGDIGTSAYYNVFREILEQQKSMHLSFSHLFLASGTGATQGGLVAGRTMAQVVCTRTGQTQETLPEVVGISIARVNPRGGEVVRESASSFLSSMGESLWKAALLQEGIADQEDGFLLLSEAVPEVHFDDHYILGGYGNYNSQVTARIQQVMEEDGIPMDTTYVGKAFCGMLSYLNDHDIHHHNILFIHTGGTPLFFDQL